MMSHQTYWGQKNNNNNDKKRAQMWPKMGGLNQSYTKLATIHVRWDKSKVGFISRGVGPKSAGNNIL